MTSANDQMAPQTEAYSEQPDPFAAPESRDGSMAFGTAEFIWLMRVTGEGCAATLQRFGLGDSQVTNNSAYAAISSLTARDLLELSNPGELLENDAAEPRYTPKGAALALSAIANDCSGWIRLVVLNKQDSFGQAYFIVHPELTLLCIPAPLGAFEVRPVEATAEGILEALWTLAETFLSEAADDSAIFVECTRRGDEDEAMVVYARPAGDQYQLAFGRQADGAPTPVDGLVDEDVVFDQIEAFIPLASQEDAIASDSPSA